MRGGDRPVRPRRVRAWALAFVALVLVPALASTPPAAAQVTRDACRAPVLALSHVPERLPPGGIADAILAIENPNGRRVDAVLATVTTTAPAGWSASVSQRELAMGPHNITLTGITLTAPNRGSGASTGNITIHVTFVCTTEGVRTTSQADATIPVRISAFNAPWTVVLTGFLLLGAGVLALGLRRLRRGITLTPLEPRRPIQPGKSAKFTLLLENRRGRPLSLRFEALDLPPNWNAHLALTDVTLEPGEEKTLWTIVRAPPDAEPDATHPITLRLTHTGTGREATSVTVDVRVVA